MRQLWDISPAVSARSPVYPGDTPFQVLWNERINDGGIANISTIHMSPHIGSHVDAPMHLDTKAPDVAALRLERFLGRCRVIDLSGAIDTEPVSVTELEGVLLCERILIKTRSRIPEGWDAGFRAISPQAVRFLQDSGVVLLGVDTPGIDPAESTLLPSHRVALLSGMAVLENLDLTEVPAGEYELIALPMKLVGVEASPVRAVLRSLSHR